MKIQQSKLLQELRNETAKAKLQLEEFKTYSTKKLNYKPSSYEWSILECIEHLNLYSKFYLPEIEKSLTNAKTENNLLFKSSFLGNYFVNMIKASNIKKIKTTKQMDVTGSNLNISTIHKFITQLEWLDSLLIKAENVDLIKVKTPISLTKLIKLRLGDTLRVLIYHNERHIIQAKKIKAKL